MAQSINTKSKAALPPRTGSNHKRHRVKGPPGIGALSHVEGADGCSFLRLCDDFQPRNQNLFPSRCDFYFSYLAVSIGEKKPRGFTPSALLGKSVASYVMNLVCMF